MSPDAQEYPYLPQGSGPAARGLAPLLPLTLSASKALSVVGLLDSGATVNVLPYSVGQQLGAVWEEQHTPVRLSGNLASCEARGLLISAVVRPFPPVRLAFAWARTDDVPLLLGQMNFFLEFDVCFYRARGVFQLRPKQAAGNPG